MLAGISKCVNGNDLCYFWTLCTSIGGGIIALELYPGFSLYRGVYELSQYSTRGIHIGTGMNWRDLNDGVNGMKEVLLIMIIEWLVVLLVAYYAEKVLSSGSGRNPLIFLNKLWKKNRREGPNASVLMDKPDVSEEVNYSSYFYLFILFAFQHRNFSNRCKF